MITKQQIIHLLLVSFVVLAMVSVSASNGLQGEKINLTTSEMKTFQNQFQNQFNFTETGNWSYQKNENNNYVFEYKNQRKFLFLTVELNKEYEINEIGEVVSEKKNFWSWIFGGNE